MQALALASDASVFKCADVLCDFCGYLAQVKASTSRDGATPPKRLPGAAWGPQKQRTDAGIYFPLFLVLVRPRPGVSRSIIFRRTSRRRRCSWRASRSVKARVERDGKASTTTCRLSATASFR